MNAYKTISKNDKNSMDETPNNQYNQGITELNNNEEDAVDKNSNLNFDISQNWDEISEFQELHASNEPQKKMEKYNKGEDSPKSFISERMNNRFSISIKNENEEEELLNPEKKEGNK